MFWWIPAGLVASGLAVFKFGYLNKVQVALGLQSVEETSSIQELLRKLQEKGEGIYTVIRFVNSLYSLFSLLFVDVEWKPISHPQAAREGTGVYKL